MASRRKNFEGWLSEHLGYNNPVYDKSVELLSDAIREAVWEVIGDINNFTEEHEDIARSTKTPEDYERYIGMLLIEQHIISGWGRV